tara:strand:+ start:74 stop:217 length:144 start_codon:yes stop_codon:yes gene_type:complete
MVKLKTATIGYFEAISARNRLHISGLSNLDEFWLNIINNSPQTSIPP